MGWVVNATPEVNSQSQWPMIITVCSVLSALSIACVSARLWIRQRSRGLASDDWMAFVSMIFALIYSIMCIARTPNFSFFFASDSRG